MAGHNRPHLGFGIGDHIENRDRQERAYHLRLEEADTFELVAGLNPIPVPAIGTAQTVVFVLPLPGTLSRSRNIRFILEPVDGAGRPVVRRARYMIPGGNGVE